LNLTCIPFKAEYAPQVLSLMRAAGQDPIAGMMEKGFSGQEDLLDEVRDSELGNESVLIVLHGKDPVAFSSQEIVYDDFLSDEERSLFGSCLFVDPDHRRQGAASSLLRELEAIAAKHGFTRVYARVSAENLPMLRLIRKQGWTARFSTVHVDLHERHDLALAREEIGKREARECTSIQARAELSASRKALSMPERRLRAITYRKGREEDLRELTVLGYSRWALQAAKKGTFYVAAKKNMVLGSCISLQGTIDHIVARSPGVREGLAWEAISELPEETKEINVACDMELADSLASRGFGPKLLIIRATAGSSADIDRVALKLASPRWYIFGKEVSPTP
jgi:GNAT superfamily N-acetyltransferase